MIAIIDYGIGNLGSVKNAFDYLKIESVITRDKDVILNADKVILPGVGAFSDAMNTFISFGFDKVIDELIKKNTPILGICVGMQMLFERSFEYGTHKGLSILKGDFVRFDDEKALVPEIGWNQIKVVNDSIILEGLDNKDCYFVHSYYLSNYDPMDVISYTEYAGVIYPSAVRRGNLFACQFHPEKSGDVGLSILKKFGEL
ncbi:MAG: imidazole glycerol phosphate synthase subunit HisH [Acholeplasmatales bacterium]|nr:imidazole glycerol phosphate synthase subunit HisH [Acholeplasmatales bacterium]